MPGDEKEKNVFISHHHKDDAEVTKLTSLLKRSGVNVRNSSIRAKPSNQARLDRGEVKDETIRRLLRMRISWAGSVIVLIGKNTHSRQWVNWEIEQANKQGKRIIGVYARGGTEADIPPSFEEYGSKLVAWNADSIIDAIEGTDSPFQSSDGAPRSPVHTPATSTC